MRFTFGGRHFNVTNFLWKQIIEAENDSRKGLPYAPYLMFIIEKVSGLTFKNDVQHTMLKITRLSPPGSSARARSPTPPSPSPPPATRHSRGPSHVSSSSS